MRVKLHFQNNFFDGNNDYIIGVPEELSQVFDLHQFIAEKFNLNGLLIHLYIDTYLIVPSERIRDVIDHNELIQ